MLLLGALALFLRLLFLGHGLPHVIYNDEGLYVYFALNMGGGDLDPRFYPSLFFYACFAADAIYVLGLYFGGKIQSFGQAWALYLADPTPFYLIGRGINAAMGALSVPLLYAAMRDALQDKIVGWLSALFLALCFLHVEYSQYALLDVPLTFFVIAAFYFAQRAASRGTLREFVYTGLMCGLATSTKYNGVATLLWAPLLAALLWKRAPAGMARWKIAARQQGVLAAAFLAGFTLGTPYWLAELGRFTNKASFMWSVYKAGGVGELGYDVQYNWLHYLGTVLPYGVGWPLEILGFAGIVLLLFSRKPAGILMAAFALAYFAIAGTSSLRAARYMLPLIPFLFGGAAHAIVLLGRRFFPSRKAAQITAAACLAAAALIPNTAALCHYLRLKARPDTRTQALEWMRQNVPAGERVLQSFFGVTKLSPQDTFVIERMDAALFDTRLFYRSALKPLEDYRREGYKFLLLDDWQMGLLRGSSMESAVFRENLEKYELFLKELEGSAVLLAEFSPFEEGLGRYDWENVQLPARDLRDMKNLGPTLRLYRI